MVKVEVKPVTWTPESGTGWMVWQHGELIGAVDHSNSIESYQYLPWLTRDEAEQYIKSHRGRWTLLQIVPGAAYETRDVLVTEEVEDGTL